MSLWSSSSSYAKDVWLPAYPQELSQAQGTFLNLFGGLNFSDAVQFEGRRVYLKLQTGDDLGFGMMPATPGGDFPTPGDISTDEAQLDLAHFAETIKFDSDEMQKLDSLSAAAAPIMEKKMTAAQARMLREIERQSIMDGSGRLGKIASVSSQTITLDVAGAEYPERNPYTWIDDANRSYYSLVNAADGVDEVAGPITVTNIDESANTLLTDTTVTAAEAGDYVVPFYGSSAWSTVRDMDGLLAMIDDGNTYMSIDRTASGKGYWKSVVDDNSGTERTLTETLANGICNKLLRRSSNGVLDKSTHCGLASPGVFTAYQNLMSPGIRYTIGESPDIGWSGREMLMMNGIPLYKHVHAPRNMILITCKPQVKYIVTARNRTSPFEFLDRGGSIFFQGNASSGQGHSDQVFAYMHGYIGMYTERPREHAKLDDLTENSSAY